MTRETLESIINDVLAEEIARRVVEKLVEMRKRALVVYTGSTMAFEESLESLRRLKEDGFAFQVVLSENAKQLLDLSRIESALRPEKVFVGEQDTPAELLAAPFETVIVPAMTINTASKITNCICDTVAARVISNSMMRGNHVIVAIDGCCPDNEQRAAKGYRMTPAMKEYLRGNLEKMRAFGATLTTAGNLYGKAQKALLRDFVPGAEAPAKPAAAAAAAAQSAPAANEALSKNVIGRSDVINRQPGSVLHIPKNALVTQLAADIARQNKVTLIRQ